MKIKYNEMKNINGRDINPKRGLVKPEWFDLNGLEQRQISIPIASPYKPSEIKKAPAGVLFTADTDEEVKREYPGAVYTTMSVNGDKEQPGESDSQISTYEVGKPGDPNCKWATIWIHGATPWRGGLGMNDTIFGGSFNRMKHLAQDNNGLYYSPTIRNFGDTRGLSSLIKYIRRNSCPKGKIILNCGSAGVSTCWKIGNDKEILNDISGMVLIGGGAPFDFQNSEFAKARIPVLFAQGERDYPEPLQELVEKVHKEDPTYPIRFMVFKDGGHMTPLRMLDWRSTMNCMLTQAPEIPSVVQGSAAPLHRSTQKVD